MTRLEVERTLKRIGLRPQPAAGQNFLLDEAVAQAMVVAANVQPGDTVLEIGPGLGILTDALLAAQAKVVAVELDQRLVRYLQKRLAGHPRLQIVLGDIFRINLHDYVTDGGYQLVANLPYSGTSLVFRNFLTLPPRPTALTVMIQREVAKRVVAQAGDYSLLALLVQYYSQPSLLMTIPPQAFWPMPKVSSAIIHCAPVHHRDPRASQDLFHLARAGFSGRRKQLRNSLAASLHRTPAEIDKGMATLGLDSTARAQDLRLEDWLKLAKAIR